MKAWLRKRRRGAETRDLVTDEVVTRGQGPGAGGRPHQGKCQPAEDGDEGDGAGHSGHR